MYSYTNIKYMSKAAEKNMMKKQHGAEIRVSGNAYISTVMNKKEAGPEK